MNRPQVPPVQSAEAALAQSGDLAWLATDTPMGALIAAHDWSQSPLGPRAAWPPGLRAIIGLLLRTPVPAALLWGRDGILLYNHACAGIAGARHPAMLGRAARDGWPELADCNEAGLRAGLAGGTLSVRDRELPGPQRFVDLDYSPVPGDDGRPAGVMAILTDSTARVLADRERQRARDVLDTMAEGYVLLDHDFRVLEINREGLRFEDRPAEAIIGRSNWELWPATRDSEIGDLYRRAMADRVPVSLDHRYSWNNGHSAWIQMRAHPVRDGLAIFYKDITVRHDAIVDTAAAAARVELALDAGAIIGTWVWDVAARQYLLDDRFALSFGLYPTQPRPGSTFDLVAAAIHDADRDRAVAEFRAVLDSGGDYRSEYRVVQSDGSCRWIEAKGRAERGPDGKVDRFSGVLIDIEARKVAERERDEATVLLRTFADAVPGVVYAKDRNGRMLVANKGTCDLIGRPRSDFIGLTDAEFLSDQQQAAVIMATDRRIMETGIAERVEEDVRLADGSAATWLSTKAPLRDDNGTVIGLVGASIDITARINAERALAEALHTSDLLLHEVNHRVKNSLQIVTSLLMLQANQVREPAVKQTLIDARARIAVIADIHQRLYATSQHDRVDFGDYVRELAMANFQSLEAAGRVAFDVDVESGIAVGVSHAVSLALVVNELITNALKYAFPDGRQGRMRLTLGLVDDTVTLTVSDDGIGLPPGFTPETSDGLGMKIVRSLVRQVRGTLSYGSVDGITRFAAEMPMSYISAEPNV